MLLITEHKGYQLG